MSAENWTVKSNWAIASPMKTGRAKSRRLTPRGAATRARIVAATADLVWARGAGALSLDDVMETSGASKSQLYHYFADKDALLQEASALQADRVLSAHAPMLAALNSLEALRRWRDAALALNRKQGCPLGALVYQLPASARTARTAVGDGFASWRRLLEDGLAKMRERGELAREANPAALALAVLSAVQGGLLLSRSEKSGRPLEAAFDMALAYVEAQAPRGPSRRGASAA